MIRPLIITIVSAFYLAAFTAAQSQPQQAGTYNNVLKYFKDHPLIDQNGTPTETFQNVLKKVAAIPKNNQPVQPAVAAVNPYRAYSPYNPYTQYQAYAQAQLRQAQAQAQAKSVAIALSPPLPPATPVPQSPSPPPAQAPQQQQQPAQAPQPPPATQPEPTPESKPENEPHPDPKPQEDPKPNPPPEQPNPEPAPAPAPEPKAEEKPPAPAPEPEQTQAPPAENKPAEADQVQPAAENNPPQATQPEAEAPNGQVEAPVTPAGDVPSNTESGNTLEVTTEAKDLAIPPASQSMNDNKPPIDPGSLTAVPGTEGLTDVMLPDGTIATATMPDGTLPNGTLSITNEVMGSVGIDGSTFSYSSIDLSQVTPPSNARPSAVQPTTYIPPMASTATRFNDLSCLVLLLLNIITLVF